MRNPQKKKPKNRKPQNPFTDYLKYSGIVFQALAVIFLCAFAGYILDGLFSLKYPVLLITLTFLGFVLALIYLIKSLFNQS